MTDSMWRHRDFMRLWTAQTISLVGTQVTALALPLTAILRLDASAFEVGILTAVLYLPFLVVGLPAGAIVDRLRRRPVLIATNVGRALLLVAVPIASWLGELNLVLLYPVAFLVGVLSVFSDVALQSYLPSLVAGEQLVTANARLELSYSGSQLAGPGIGGVLVQLLTAPIAILADVLSYVAATLLLLFVRHREPIPQGTGRLVDLGQLRQDMAAGLRYVWGHRMIRPLAFATGTANFFYLFGMTGAVLTLFAVRQLHMTPVLIGVALLLGNIGAVAGSLASTWFLAHLRFGTLIVIAPLSAAASIALIALATPATAVAFLALGVIVGEFGTTVYDIAQISLRQAVTPSVLLGRMNATVRFMNWGPIPVGAFVGGILGQLIGLRPVLWVAAAGCLLPAVWLLRSALPSLSVMPGAEVPESIGAVT
jgi:Transmembrane secretion effector